MSASNIYMAWQQVIAHARDGYEKTQIIRLSGHAKAYGLPPTFDITGRDRLLGHLEQKVRDAIKVVNNGLSCLAKVAKRHPELDLVLAPRIKMESAIKREELRAVFGAAFSKSLDEYSDAQRAPYDKFGRKRTLFPGAIEKHPSTILLAAKIVTEAGLDVHTIGDLTRADCRATIIKHYGSSDLPSGGRSEILIVLRLVATHLEDWTTVEAISTQLENMPQRTNALSRETRLKVLGFTDQNRSDLLGALSKVISIIEEGFPQGAALGHVQGAFGALFTYFFACSPEICSSIQFTDEPSRATQWGMRPVLIATQRPGIDVERRFGPRLIQFVDGYWDAMPEALKVTRRFFLNDHGDPIEKSIIKKRILKEIQKIDVGLTPLMLVDIKVKELLKRGRSEDEISQFIHLASSRHFRERYGALITAIKARKIKATNESASLTSDHEPRLHITRRSQFSL